MHIGKEISVNDFPTVAESGPGLSIAAALCRLRAFTHVSTSVRYLCVQQALQVFYVVYGRPQGLHFTEPLVLQLLRQMFPEPCVAFIDAAHPVPLALVALADERRLEGVVAHPVMQVQVGEATIGEALSPHRVQVEGQPQVVIH